MTIEESEAARYKIVRFYRNGRKRTIRKNQTLAMAQAHCKDPRTRKPGVYFDGYELQKVKEARS